MNTMVIFYQCKNHTSSQMLLVILIPSLFYALAAHVHSRGPEGDGDPAGSEEEDCKVCQRESEQAGGHIGWLPPEAQKH